MSMENVKEFLALVKTDEGLARKVVELKDNLQNSANLGSEVEILAEKVLPLAKAHGLEFTAEEFLAYANSVSGELSDDDLLDVSGGISARGVALGLLFATGLSFVPTIVSSFAIGGGSAPETSISQSYDAGDSLQQDDEIDVDAAEDNQVSPQLQAAREKVERLQQELSRKKRGKSNVSKGYMKTFQELEKAKANVERLEKIEREKTENNKKDIVSEIQEFRETKKDQQEDLGVGLADNELEEKHEERQDEIKDQVENKEKELEKKDEVVEEKNEEKKEEVSEEDVVEEAAEEKKDEVAEEKKDVVEEKKEEVAEEKKEEIVEEKQEEVVEEKKAKEDRAKEKSEEQMKTELVKGLKDNSLVYKNGDMISGFEIEIFKVMKTAGVLDLSEDEQKQMLTEAIKEVLPEADESLVAGYSANTITNIGKNKQFYETQYKSNPTPQNKTALREQAEFNELKNKRIEQIDNLLTVYGSTMSAERKATLDNLKTQASGATKEKLAEIEETLTETEETLKKEAEQYNAKLEELKKSANKIDDSLYDLAIDGDENYDALDAKYRAIKSALEQGNPDLKQIENEINKLEDLIAKRR